MHDADANVQVFFCNTGTNCYFLPSCVWNLVGEEQYFLSYVVIFMATISMDLEQQLTSVRDDVQGETFSKIIKLIH